MAYRPQHKKKSRLSHGEKVGEVVVEVVGWLPTQYGYPQARAPSACINMVLLLIVIITPLLIIHSILICS